MRLVTRTFFLTQAGNVEQGAFSSLDIQVKECHRKLARYYLDV
jgi:hypothetical protein